MHILILTVGSRGDVQPYVALGLGLQAAGHSVTLATVAAFEGFIKERGLGVAPLRGEFLELLQTPEGKAAVVGKGNPLALLRKVMPMLRTMLDDEWSAAAGAEALIYHPKALGGHSIAEKLGVSQPTVSEHMRLLVRAGLVRARRIKQWTFYRRDDERLAEVLRTLRAL